jgi:hypothetical protein
MSFIVGAMNFVTTLMVKKQILKNSKVLLEKRNETFNTKLAVLDAKIKDLSADIQTRMSQAYRESLGIKTHVANEHYLDHLRGQVQALSLQRQEMIDEELKYQREIIKTIHQD